MIKQYSGVKNKFSKIIQQYGGWRSMLASPYFHVSFLTTIVTYGLWCAPGWEEIVLSISPGLLGFTLGGYALAISFGSDKFQAIITAKTEEDKSIYLSLSSTFAVFIVTETLALMLALIFKSYLNVEFTLDNYSIVEVYSFISFFIFIYSIAQIVSATLWIFKMSEWNSTYHEKVKDNQKLEETCQFCYEKVYQKAVKCRHCGSRLDL